MKFQICTEVFLVPSTPMGGVEPSSKNIFCNKSHGMSRSAQKNQVFNPSPLIEQRESIYKSFSRNWMKCPDPHRKVMFTNALPLVWMKCPDPHRKVMFTNSLPLVWVDTIYIKNTWCYELNEMSESAQKYHFVNWPPPLSPWGFRLGKDENSVADLDISFNSWQKHICQLNPPPTWEGCQTWVFMLQRALNKELHKAPKKGAS